MTVAFGILAVFGVLCSVLALWARQVIFDPQTVSSAVERALEDPEVTNALAEYVTDQVFLAVPVESVVESKLPPDLESVSPLLVGGLRTVVQQGVERLISLDSTRELIVRAAEVSHGRLMEVLEGGSLVDGVNVEDDRVSVNLLPLVGRGVEFVQDAGLLTDVELPDLSRGGDPDEQIAQLSEAIGRSLPDQFGQLTVYESESVGNAQLAVAKAQQAVVIFKRSILAVILVTILSLVISVVTALRRRRALIALGIGITGAMVLSRVIINKVQDQVPLLALKPGARAALRSIVVSFAKPLLTAATAALVIGLVLTVAAWFSGTQTFANLVDRGAGLRGGLGRHLGDHRDLVAVAGFAAAVLVIYLFGLSVLPIVVAGLLVISSVAALVATASRSDVPHPAGTPADGDR